MVHSSLRKLMSSNKSYKYFLTKFKFTFTEVKVMVGVINPLQKATYLRYQRTSVLCCPWGLPLWWCRPAFLGEASRPWFETPCGRRSRGTAGTPGTSDARTSAESRSERPTPRSPETPREKTGWNWFPDFRFGWIYTERKQIWRSVHSYYRRYRFFLSTHPLCELQ